MPPPLRDSVYTVLGILASRFLPPDPEWRLDGF